MSVPAPSRTLRATLADLRRAIEQSGSAHDFARSTNELETHYGIRLKINFDWEIRTRASIAARDARRQTKRRNQDGDGVGKWDRKFFENGGGG
jgi:hypothetical protein